MSISPDCNYRGDAVSITNKLNQIKNAIYGKEVRGAIHDAIKECYDDASVNHDNANMEVKMARGTHNTLNDRLDNVDEIQAQTNVQLSDVKNTMDVECVKKSEVTNVLTPKGNESYLNLPKNNNNIGDYYYCNDGDSINGAGNYVWNGSEWYFGGTSDNGYSYVISEMDKRCKIKNYWNHEGVVDGYYVHTSFVSNNNYCYIKIPVKYGDVVRCNNNMRFIAQQCTSTGSITSVENVKELTCNKIDGNGIKVRWVYISIPMGQKNNTIVTINDADLTYIDYGYYGKYLIAHSSERVLKNENITHLSKNKGRINNLGGYSALDATYYTFTNFLKIKSKMTIDYILEGIVNTALISTYDCNKNLKRVFQSDNGVINAGTFETLDDECYIRFTTSTSYDNLLVLKYGDYEEETHFQYPNNLLLAKNLFKSGLFIGDSMTAYNGTIKKYPEFVRDFTGMKVDFSCAISGGNAVNVFSEKVFTKDFTDNDFDVCFIMLGTNGGYTDTLESDTDFESYLDYNSNATGSVCKIIEHVKANTTDITIFIVSIPVSNVSSGPNARLSNDVLQQIANKYDVGYLDIYNNGTINWGNLVNYTTEDDRVHRTSFGNATMADDVIRLMAEEFNKNPNRYKLLNSLGTIG